MRSNIPKLLILFFLFFSCDFVFAENNLPKNINKDSLNFKQKTVVLTFDDGPSEFTPQILDILNDNSVKGVFFINGKNIKEHPDIIKRIYNDGHEVGNHTFNHRDLRKKSNWLTNLELNLNRFFIESETNHSTRIFRAPYFGVGFEDNEPSMDVVNKVDGKGYFYIGVDIDSFDWKKPGVNEIIKNSVNEKGGIVLLHDGGGNREQTVMALPHIINNYKDKGFDFIGINDLLKMEKQLLMPKISIVENIISSFVSKAYIFFIFLKELIHGIIYFFLILSVVRFMFVILGAIFQYKLRRSKSFYKKYIGSSSIILPAYNEEKVIKDCIESLLNSNRKNFEIILVDDGSTDDTAKKAQEIKDKRLKIYSKKNGGKASALNYALSKASYEILIAIDADTIFKKDTINKLIDHFGDPRIGAVSGNVKIGNNVNLLTRIQSLEYINGFNLDRRMGDFFNCITVIPGAIGAFRKDVVNKVGNFSSDTLAEDTDLTIAIRKLGCKIVYDSSAIAYTEAPKNFKDFFKQRFRWCFGTLQVMWKHKKNIFNYKIGTLGLIGLPNMVFSYINALMNPFFDLMIIIFFILNFKMHYLLFFYPIFYIILDLLSSALSYFLEEKNVKRIWLVFLQRVFYRQVISFVIFKSVLHAIKGSFVAWDKLSRDGILKKKLPRRI